MITLDEEIYKDIQYLMKFWSWHGSAVKKDMFHFKYRPAFNVDVKKNARAYWKYAIKSTIYYIRKNKQKTSGAQRAKRQTQMIELSELYKLSEFNGWIKDNYSSKLQAEHTKFLVDT